MTDPRKVIALLKVLKEYKDANLLETVLHDQLNPLLPRPCSSVEFAETLGFCIDKGHAAYRVDEFGEKRWYITTAGELFLLRS